MTMSYGFFKDAHTAWLTKGLRPAKLHLRRLVGMSEFDPQPP